MTPDDAKKLLAHAAAFDNRKPSLAAALAWAKALHDVPLDQDALDAIARFYGTIPTDPSQRLWLQPHDVRNHRTAIRNERLENFAYEPPAGELDPDYLNRYRRQLAAVASGVAPAPTSAPALTGGPHKTVEGQLAGIGRTVPDRDEPKIRRSGPLGVHCSTCYAPIGHRCKTPAGKPRGPHAARLAAAGVPGAEAPLPPEQAAAEEQRRRHASQIHLADGAA